MTRKHFREVDFARVHTALDKCNTTLTETRFEALQNQSSSSNPYHCHKSCVRLGLHLPLQKRPGTLVVIAEPLWASLFPAELFPWETNNSFLSASRAESYFISTESWSG